MTTDTTGRIHDEIAQLLPNYILGALPDDGMRRIAEHLDGCAVCRAEYDDALVTSSLLFDAGPVDRAIREALVARLSPGTATPFPARLFDAPPTSHPDARQSSWVEARPKRLSGPVTRLVTAVAAAIVIAVGGWGLLDWLGDDGGEIVAELTGNPAFAHDLTDTGIGSTASGVIYVDPADDVAYVTATGLAPLPEGRGYQVWLFTETGEQVSAGFLPVGEDGNVEALVTAPASFGAYVAVGLSAEPLAGSVSPTGPLALGGWIG